MTQACRCADSRLQAAMAEVGDRPRRRARYRTRLPNGAVVPRTAVAAPSWTGASERTLSATRRAWSGSAKAPTCTAQAPAAARPSGPELVVPYICAAPGGAGRHGGVRGRTRRLDHASRCGSEHAGGYPLDDGSWPRERHKPVGSHHFRPGRLVRGSAERGRGRRGRRRRRDPASSRHAARGHRSGGPLPQRQPRSGPPVSA